MKVMKNTLKSTYQVKKSIFVQLELKVNGFPFAADCEPACGLDLRCVYTEGLRHTQSNV